jgi:hypothetical protein
MSPTDLGRDGTFDPGVRASRSALSRARSWTLTGPLHQLFSHLRVPLYKNGYSLILSSATTSGLGMLFWVLAAHYYSVETIGTSSAMIAAMMFLSGVSQRGMNSALVRFVPLAGRASARLVSFTYLISLVIAGAAARAGFVSLVSNLGCPGWRVIAAGIVRRPCHDLVRVYVTGQCAHRPGAGSMGSNRKHDRVCH